MYIKGVGVGCFDDLDPCDDIAIKTQIYSNIFKTMKGEYEAKKLHNFKNPGAGTPSHDKWKCVE